MPCPSTPSAARLALAARLAFLALAPTARAQEASQEAAHETPTSATPLAPARLALTVDLALNSAFVSRGVTTTNRFVLQPDLLLEVPLGRAGRTTVTLGGWTNIEPSLYDGPRDISPLGGASGPAATASELWAEVRRETRVGELALGATRYLYPDVGTLAETYATTEIYAVAAGESLLGVPLSPSVAAYVDVQKVRGAYVEGSVAVDVGVPLRRRPAHTVTISARLGYSAGQGEDARGAQAANFAGDGFTHAELAARTDFDFGALSVAPNAHLILGRDALVRVLAPDRSRAAKLWLGATLTWASRPDRGAR